MLAATMCEAFGILSLLPLLQINFERSAQTHGMTWFTEGLNAIGVSLTFGTALAFVCLGLIISQVLKFFCLTYVAVVSSKFGSDLRLRLVEALARARGDYLLARPIGLYSSLLGTETNRAATTFIATCNLGAHIVASIVLIVSAVLVDWRVTAAALVLGMIMAVVLGGLLTMSRDAGMRITHRTNALLSQVTDVFSSIKPLKAMGREQRMTSLIREDIFALDYAQRAQALAKNGMASGQDILVLICLAGGAYVAHAMLNYPISLLAVLAVLFQRAASSMGQLQKDYQGILSSESALKGMLDSVSEAANAREVMTGGKYVTFSKEIKLENVTFSYGETTVLRNFSLRIPAKGLTVIAGPSGAGKTTVVDMIAGLHVPSSGAVTIDGELLSEISIAKWREQIGYVPQDTILFHDTVRHNITLGDDTLSQERILSALEAAGAADFVSRLPRGIETVVGERGGKISGGQRQRIALARAIVRSPRLLILDEATSALDPATELELCKTLKEISAHTAVLAISHRSALTKYADYVVTLGLEGQLLDDGLSRFKPVH